MLRDQGARIEVDGGPGPGLEKRGLQRVKVDGWVGFQLASSVSPSFHHPHPVLMNPPTEPQGPKEGSKPNCPPFPSWVRCTKVGPGHNLSVGVANSIADLCARGLCVSVGVSVGVYVCVFVVPGFVFTCASLCLSLFVGISLWPVVCLNILCPCRVAVCL